MEHEIRPSYIYGIIYKYTNTVNGKVYIGQTTQSMYKRRSEHKTAAKKDYKRGYKSPFQAALRKYGPELFHEEILFAAFDKEALDNAEKWYIANYQAVDRRFGYNLTYGGQESGMHLEATKQKISAASKAHWNDPNYRAHMATKTPNISGLKTTEAKERSRITRRSKAYPTYATDGISKGWKICSRCRRYKIITDYGSDPRAYDQHTSVCLNCLTDLTMIRHHKKMAKKQQVKEQWKLEHPGQQQCTQCKVIKPFADFPKSKKTSDGLAPYCKACKSEGDRQWRQNNVDKKKANDKIYAAAHHEHLKQYRHEWYLQHKETKLETN